MAIAKTGGTIISLFSFAHLPNAGRVHKTLTLFQTFQSVIFHNNNEVKQKGNSIWLSGLLLPFSTMGISPDNQWCALSTRWQQAPECFSIYFSLKWVLDTLQQNAGITQHQCCLALRGMWIYSAPQLSAHFRRFHNPGSAYSWSRRKTVSRDYSQGISTTKHWGNFLRYCNFAKIVEKYCIITLRMWWW